MTAGTISAHVVRAILAGAAARGLDPGELARRFGVAPALLVDVDARVPAELTVAMWDEVPALAGDPWTFGLRLGETAGVGALTLAGHMIQASPTLREGVRAMLAYYRVFNDVHPPELEEAGGVVHLRVRTRGTPLPGPRHAMEFALAWLVALARRTTGVALVPRAVHFEHAPPPDDAAHRGFFGAKVHWEAPHAGLEVDAATLDLPNQAPDPTLVELLASHARGLLAQLPGGGGGVTAAARRAVLDRVARGEPSVADVARAVGTSPRTLQRRLADEGTSFVAVVDGVRHDLALRYLDDPTLTIGEVALLLGFADQASFHRAFVRWSGRTPGQHRRR